MDIREKLKPPLDKSRAATEGMTALIAVVGRGRWFIIKKHCGNGHDNHGNSYPTQTLNCATNNARCFHFLSLDYSMIVGPNSHCLSSP